jgi:hypothetical protein
MSTNASIGVQNANKSITSIYLHFDGYPDHTLTILKMHYNTLKLARQLMRLGDLSSLGKNIGKKQDFDNPIDLDACLAYGRDRGEIGTKAIKVSLITDWQKVIQTQYAYLFVNNKWKQMRFRI